MTNHYRIVLVILAVLAFALTCSVGTPDANRNQLPAAYESIQEKNS